MDKIIFRKEKRINQGSGKARNYLFTRAIRAASGLSIVIRPTEGNVLVTLALLVENRITFVHVDSMVLYGAATFAGHDYLRRDQLPWNDSVCGIRCTPIEVFIALKEEKLQTPGPVLLEGFTFSPVASVPLVVDKKKKKKK